MFLVLPFNNILDDLQTVGPNFFCVLLHQSVSNLCRVKNFPSSCFRLTGMGIFLTGERISKKSFLKKNFYSLVFPKKNLLFFFTKISCKKSILYCFLQILQNRKTVSNQEYLFLHGNKYLTFLLR